MGGLLASSKSGNMHGSEVNERSRMMSAAGAGETVVAAVAQAR
jgi:hypothetical protein